MTAAPPQIAYLIMVHHQPAQLFRLISRLNQINVFFFIHIDTKSRDTQVIKDSLAAYPNVKIISVYDVKWAGFTQVKAEIDLLKLAYARGIHFKYYVLLSGQDYPIKSNKYINDFFTSRHSDFISYNELDYLPESFKDKVRYFHFPDIAYVNPRHPKKIPALVKLYYALQKRIKKILPARHFYKGMTPHFGSNWFAITHDTVKVILEFIAKNPDYLHFMKFTENPDEIFFQTIILNSERKNNLYDYSRYLNWLNSRKEGEVFVQAFSSLRYMDWSESGKPKPAILDASYYETLKASEELFARKVDQKISLELMNSVDSNIL